MDHFESKRVLVIDDDPVVRGLMVASLEEAGHSVESVTDDEVAWCDLLSNNYDLLVTDDVRGKVSRLASLRKIRVISCLDYLQS
jgi:CheY-like chemotaxis protein